MAQAQQAAPPAAAASTVPAAPTVNVERYLVEGNTLIVDEQLQPALRPFTGTVTMARIRAAAASVQAAYRQAGYGGVVAFLPEQEVVGGTVRIRVVEGRLSRVAIRGAAQFSDDNVRASLPSLALGHTPLVRRIDAEIQMANENPSKNVQVLLQPGAATADVTAEVAVTEKPVLRPTARLDNTGTEATGRSRLAVGLQHANMAGRDHVLALELQTAPEAASALRVLSGSYRVPLYGRAMALDGYFARSDIDAGTISTAAGDLQISGKGLVAGARAHLYLPRRGNVDQRLVLGLESREYRNSCTIGGLPQAACGAAGVSVAVQPLSLTYLAQAVGAVRWGVSVGLHGNSGLGGGSGSEADFDAVRAGASRRYVLLRYGAQWQAPLGEWGGLSVRLNGQQAREPLVPGEMFGAGGAISVRGYEEREIVGDSGQALTLEIIGPGLLRGPLALPGVELRPVAFADAARVANTDAAQCRAGRTRCGLAGAGIGLRGKWQAWQLRLDASGALSDAQGTSRGDTRVHLQLSYSP